MRRGIKKFALAAVLTALGAAVLSGCGKKAAAADSGITKVVVGTGNAYEPYCYLDEKGELAGYEYQVLKAVDELLPQYEFDYQTSDFANVLISLDAGKIDIAAHQYEWNEERDEKYLFGKEPYTTYVTYLAVANDRTDIQSLDDLKGRKVKSSTGSNSVYILENYNKDHEDNPIKIDYVNNSTDEETVTGLLNGVWDATILTKRDTEKLNKNYGNGKEVIKVTGEPIQSSSTYFIFAKDNTQLQEAVDEAVKQLKESGKLAQISKDVIGGDYTESE
ncbi:MAG: transporter substrate-binding domain-containing protein [Lacrimispora celerecrescens]|uniref:transporter substrate-binding domain-containing protein n=1 Tax=Lacrimispora indolis TaxID=69825 RepID=UPI0003F6B275|nr:transporter substrate-binding domain-containing protein [[Clostridium] methoxybenzovorans]MBE7719171.1 transporter substrate-binding domain-containing protein [Lacrimispora celerecrescens]